MPLRIPQSSPSVPQSAPVYVAPAPAPVVVPVPAAAPNPIVIIQDDDDRYDSGISAPYVHRPTQETSIVPAQTGAPVNWDVDWGSIAKALLTALAIAGAAVGAVVTIRYFAMSRTFRLMRQGAGDWTAEKFAGEMENQKGCVVALTVTVLDSMPGLEGLVKSLLSESAHSETEFGTVEGVKWIMERLSESLARHPQNATHAIISVEPYSNDQTGRSLMEVACSRERSRFEEDSEYFKNGELVAQTDVQPVNLGNSVGRYVCFTFILKLKHDRSPFGDVKTSQDLVEALIVLQSIDPSNIEDIQLSYSPGASEILAGDTLSEDDFIEMYPEAVALA